jgi:hypothetical protein
VVERSTRDLKVKGSNSVKYLCLSPIGLDGRRCINGLVCVGMDLVRLG